MSTEKSTETASGQLKPKQLIRSQYKDVMVKIDEDIYYLDRLQLALKSGYFEKLFIEDYSDRNNDLIEIPLMDTDTFSAVVDIIYGEKWESVVNSDNFVSLLMAMDYLQMDINTEICKTIVNSQLRNWREALNNDILFKLYYFIADDTSYMYLLPIVFQRISEYLETLQNHQQLLSIKFDHFTKIIMCRQTLTGAVSDGKGPLRMLSKICARWICHDMENRLHHVPGLLNAARFRCHLSNITSCEDFNSLVSTNDQHLDQDSVSRYFYKWLMYCGSIRCSNSVPFEPFEVPEAPTVIPETSISDEYGSEYENESDDSQAEDIQFTFSREPKLKTFLKNKNFCDITLKVGDKIYQLHRSVLKSESLYFVEIFSKEYSELAAKCEGVPNPPSKDEIYSINEIDSATFDVIIDHMYLGKVEPKCGFIFLLLKAVHVLRIDTLKEPCCEWMKTNCRGICVKDFGEIVNFTYANIEYYEYKELNRVFLNKYINYSWPDIDNLPQFADLRKAIGLPEGTNSDEIYAYMIGNVHLETFKVIINHSYFDEAKWLVESLAEVLDVSDMFKMEKLTEECVKRLLWWPNKLSMSSTDVEKVLRITLKNVEYYEVVNTVYLVKHMIQWPRVDMELFCSISYECLENMLTSYDLYFKDPRDLLDICSKWIVHDVENRYRLTGQIALAISQNRIADCGEHSIANPSDFKECTQDFVKDEIWKILSSTSVLPFPLFHQNEAKKRKTELPVFIASHEARLFQILNGDLDEIVSFRLCENVPESKDRHYIVKYPMSATIINDNLFMLCYMRESCFFHVYNLSSQTLFSLASDRRMFQLSERQTDYEPCTLLNCRDEIYCCFRIGEVLKYSFEFNRWMQFSSREQDWPRTGIVYSSDGNELYRMYKSTCTRSTVEYSMQVYDFQKNSWVSSPNLPSLSNSEYYNCENDRVLHEFVFLKNYGFVALFRVRVFILGQQTRVWKKVDTFPFVNGKVVVKNCLFVCENEAEEMLLMNVNRLFRFRSADEIWIWQKEWPYLESTVSPTYSRKILPYGNIIGIHNPKIHT